MEKSKTIVPMGKWILVKYMKKNETESGIILPETADEGGQGFLVIATGLEVEKVHKDDYILFDIKKCIAVKVDDCDPDHFLILEENVFGWLKDKAVV